MNDMFGIEREIPPGILLCYDPFGVDSGFRHDIQGGRQAFGLALTLRFALRPLWGQESDRAAE